MIRRMESFNGFWNFLLMEKKVKVFFQGHPVVVDIGHDFKKVVLVANHNAIRVERRTSLIELSCRLLHLITFANCRMIALCFKFQ